MNKKMIIDNLTNQELEFAFWEIVYYRENSGKTVDGVISSTIYFSKEEHGIVWDKEALICEILFEIARRKYAT
ncbi:hypothetical protein EHV15_34195 [Paenibacillus oralis]|uniref:Uncharacterized protein n=1 Tax=Paenibacillus oralis TaxID=2490856 RepID=A0A3P3T9H2_9BACL|nr:hypothetical protein [Paenibacillus oralis]RRJ54650.1 hypothetical protein EHV15_34195 [Paenibacillus oralis]